MGKFDVDLNVQYTNWEDKKAQKLAEKYDKDGKAGLNTVEEILKFFEKAQKKNIDINEIFGLDLSAKARRASAKQPAEKNYEKLVNYYNSLDDTKKSDIGYQAHNIGYELMYQLEKDINTAFENCKGYGLIKLRRYRFEDKVRFNLEEVQNDVTVALNSVNELQKDLEKAYDTAKGTEGTEAKYVDYNAQLERIAQQKLGMSYDEFVEKYKDILHTTESITESEAMNPQYEHAEFYDKARTYVREIKKLARETLQETRTESGERLLDETVKYSNSSIELIDFEYDGVTNNSINNMSSDIMRKAFIEAVEADYNKTDIDETKADSQSKDGKYFDKENHKYYIIKNGKKYNINGTVAD